MKSARYPPNVLMILLYHVTWYLVSTRTMFEKTVVCFLAMCNQSAFRYPSLKFPRSRAGSFHRDLSWCRLSKCVSNPELTEVKTRYPLCRNRKGPQEFLWLGSAVLLDSVDALPWMSYWLLQVRARKKKHLIGEFSGKGLKEKRTCLPVLGKVYR